MLLLGKEGTSMKKLKFILPSIQIILTIVAVIIDHSINNGHGEGSNQVLANLVSNIEFFIKNFLGYDDIVNYNFNVITVLLAIGLWFLVGLLLDNLISKIKVVRTKSTLG